MNKEYESVDKFEKTIADFFGAPYAVATDCCTNALELSIRITDYANIKVPVHTYVSVPYMLMKNGWQFTFTDEKWKGYHYLTDQVIDAAVYWKKNGYIPGTLMCLSFFKRKHLSTDRGGIILLDDKDKYENLIRLVYDGRNRSDTPYNKQKCGMGYHYYMTSDKANLGLQNFEKVKDKKPIEKNWDWYTPVNQYSTVFGNEDIIFSSE